MNCVVCKYTGDNGKYLFQVPQDVELDVDTMVLVETSHRDQPAVCITGTFRADPEAIWKHWGEFNGKIKRVLKVMREFPLEWPEKEEAKTTGSIEDEDDSD